MSTKIADERSILGTALPLLQSIYGQFEVDANQVDSPDAALILADGRRIGVEITSLDRREDLQYDNDPNIRRDAEASQLARTMAGQEPLRAPTTALKVRITRSYLSERAMKKASNYARYKESGGYDEVILLTASRYAHAKQRRFAQFYVPQARWDFHKAGFPFDKVAFVCAEVQGAILTHDVNDAPASPPADFLYPANVAEAMRIHGSIDHTLELSQVMAAAPLARNIPRAERAQKKGGKKSKRKGS